MVDPTTILAIKLQPTLENHWSLGEETKFNMAKHNGTWYFEGRYLTLHPVKTDLTANHYIGLLLSYGGLLPRYL